MNFNDSHAEQVQFFESLLFESLGSEITVEGYRMLSGGNLSNAVRLETREGFFFLKWNEHPAGDFFSSHAQSLELLRATQLIKIPEVLGFGKKGDKSYILLEYLSVTDPAQQCWKNLGTALAALHRLTAPQAGLAFNNYFFSLLQNNAFIPDCTSFFIENRLRPQAGLAFYNGEISLDFLHRIEKFCLQLPALLPPAPPALLHGNLTAGSVIATDFQQPALIDPAAYFGFREAEIAYTRLFGGFETVFYESYQAAFPLEPGFEDRMPLYNLYPLLVHVNLFGAGGYASGVEKVLKRHGC